MLNYFTFLGCYCYLNELKFYISLNACIRTWCGPSFPNSYTLFCTILATSVLFLVTFMDDILAHFLLRKHTFVHFHEVLSQSSHQLDHDLGIHEIVAFSRSPISIQPPTGPWLRNSRNPITTHFPVAHVMAFTKLLHRSTLVFYSEITINYQFRN